MYVHNIYIYKAIYKERESERGQEVKINLKRLYIFGLMWEPAHGSTYT